MEKTGEKRGRGEKLPADGDGLDLGARRGPIEAMIAGVQVEEGDHGECHHSDDDVLSVAHDEG